MSGKNWSFLSGHIHALCSSIFSQVNLEHLQLGWKGGSTSAPSTTTVLLLDDEIRVTTTGLAFRHAAFAITENLRTQPSDHWVQCWQTGTIENSAAT
jgi:hypothetical protein